MGLSLGEDKFVGTFAAVYPEVSDDPLPDDFTLDSPLELLSIDSLGRIELIGLLEDRLGTRISDDSLRNAKSLRDIYLAAVTGVDSA